MRKLIILFVAITVCSVSYGQFVLSPNNFVNMDDTTKNYIVIEVPETSKSSLYIKAKKYFNQLYNNPKYVASEIENEQIVIDAITNSWVMMYNWTGNNQWALNYKIDVQFRDNKIKFTPIFKSLKNADYQKVALIGDKIMGINTGMFTTKGKVTLKKGNKRIDEYINSYFLQFKKAMEDVEKVNEEW